MGRSLFTSDASSAVGSLPESDDIVQEKRRLRAVRRAKRERLDSADAAMKSHAIVRALVPMLAGVSDVALFWPLLERREIDLRPLDVELRQAGKRIYYPWMQTLRAMAGDCLRRVDDPLALEQHPTGFLQPHATAPEATRVDVIIVPALAATAEGERLGYGAGYYDRLLPRYPAATTICVIYDFEVVSALPRSALDHRVHWVLTDQRRFGPLANGR